MIDLWIAGVLLFAAIVFLYLSSRGRGRRGDRAFGGDGGVSNELPEAPDGALAHYAVLDFQTTGLDVAEDRILQAAWLVMDSSFRLVRKGTCIVLQESVGSLEARSVHRLNLGMIERYGMTEEAMVRTILSDISDVPILVAHNMAFDLGVFGAAVNRSMPEIGGELEAKETICTMTDFINIGEGEKYPSLMELSQKLLGISAIRRWSHDPVAWRNVCLTRACLIRLIADKEAKANLSEDER